MAKAARSFIVKTAISKPYLFFSTILLLGIRILRGQGKHDSIKEVRKEGVRWFGSVQSEKCEISMLRTELPNRRRGGPKRRFMDVVREDMQVGNWCNSVRCRGQGEIAMSDWLWQSLTRAAER